MNDIEWLDRVWRAYEIYKDKYNQELDLDHFVHWLYSVYGIVPPHQRKSRE